jgi:hypothetical protein
MRPNLWSPVSKGPVLWRGIRPFDEFIERQGVAVYGFGRANIHPGVQQTQELVGKISNLSKFFRQRQRRVPHVGTPGVEIDFG